MTKKRQATADSIKKLIAKPIAHRGLHNKKSGIIENSFSAFENAINAGYFIECDLQLTKDNQAIVFHDDSLERLCEQQRNIADIDLAEAKNITLKNSTNKDKIQSFAQMLEQVNGQVAIFIELKAQQGERNIILAKAAVEALRNYRGDAAIISFSPIILGAVKKFGFQNPTGIVVEKFTSDSAKTKLSWLERFYLRHMLHFFTSKFDFIDADHKALDLPIIKFLQKLGFFTICWTIKSQNQSDIALKKCDQICFEGFIPKEKT